MTAPIETKTVRISPGLHQRIMDMGAEHRWTADETLGALLSPNTAVITLTATQHERWTAAAKDMGVTLPQFINLHVEAAIGGLSTALLEKTFYTVRALAQQAGVRPSLGPQQSIDNPPRSTD